MPEITTDELKKQSDSTSEDSLSSDEDENGHHCTSSKLKKLLKLNDETRARMYEFDSRIGLFG